ncbi:MAG: hypothetical protein AB7L91_06235 [Dehalococcoidia bacterium]
MTVNEVTALLVLMSVALGLLTSLAGLAWRFIVRPIGEVNDRLSRLEHEVGPNGDRTDDGRPLRAIVRSQCRDIADIKTDLRDGARRFRSIEDHIGMPHGEGHPSA